MLKLSGLLLFVSIVASSCFSLFESDNNAIVTEVYNNQKSKKAILFLKDGNATRDNSLHVSVVDSGHTLSGTEVGNVFTTDSNHNLASVDSASIHLSWLGNDTLQIVYDNRLRTFSKATQMDGTVIVYNPIAGKQDSSVAGSAIKKYEIDKGGLSGKMINIKVNYGGVACTCAQWIESSKLADTANEREYFYLEQGEPGTINADTVFNGTNMPVQLLLSGQFYNKVGYPANYNPAKGEPEPARVFRYQKITILKQ